MPRGARITVAKSLASVLHEVCIKNDTNSWHKLFCFAFSILHVENNNNKKSLTAKIRENVKNNQFNLPHIDFTSHASSSSLEKKVEDKVADGCVGMAARLLFSSDTMAPNNSETLRGLHDKHPLPLATSQIPDSPNSDFQPLQVKEIDTLKAIMSFPGGSAGGVDGITPQHLKDLISKVAGEAGSTLLKELTSLANLMLSGKVPTDIVPVLYGANLCALLKKDGGIRPIAIGCTFRRLASKLCCRSIFDPLSSYFQPIQLGFGTKGGCEAAVHAARSFLNSPDSQVFLKIDVKNAFNSIDRGALLGEIKNHCPNIYNYLWQCYSAPTKLTYFENEIESKVGCQQGDPLGPAIFSLGLHPLIKELNSKFNVWYLDDGTLGGSVSTVLNDLENISTKFSSIGLDLNFSKCELFISDSLFSENEKQDIVNKFNVLAPNIKILSKHNLTLLGAPLFDESVDPILN